MMLPEKIDLRGIPIFEKKDPLYKSHILGVPAWILALVIAGYNIAVKK